MKGWKIGLALMLLVLFAVFPYFVALIILGYLFWKYGRFFQPDNKRRYLRRDEVLAVYNKSRGIFGFGTPSCQNCGSRNNLHIDHVTPLGRGGNNDINNLRLLCRSCNLKRKK